MDNYGSRHIQKIEIDMSAESSQSYTLDEEITPGYDRIISISAHVAKAATNCRVYNPVRVGGKEVFPKGFDTALIYPTRGNDLKYMNVDIPLKPQYRITGGFENPNSVTTLTIVLVLVNDNDKIEHPEPPDELDPKKRYIKTVALSNDFNTTAYEEFDFKPPDFCKRLYAIHPYSADFANTAQSTFDIEVAAWLNAKAINTGNDLFPLGYNAQDDPEPKMMVLNREIDPGSEITGFVRRITDKGAQTIIKLNFIFETE